MAQEVGGGGNVQKNDAGGKALGICEASPKIDPCEAERGESVERKWMRDVALC